MRELGGRKKKRKREGDGFRGIEDRPSNKGTKLLLKVIKAIIIIIISVGTKEGRTSY